MLGRILSAVALTLVAVTAQAQSAACVSNEREAKAAIESRGYRNVKNLTLDPVGNWSAEAVRDSLEVAVILQVDGEIAEE